MDLRANPRKRRRKRRTTKRRRARASAPRRRRTRRRRTRNAMLPGYGNPRRRRTRKKRRAYGRRKRNASITPFVMSSNPLVMSNPRRRRKRNPGLKLNFKSIAQELLTVGGGSLVGAAANMLAINKISNVWARNGARLGAAIAAGAFLKGNLGAAAAGSVLYPMYEEVYIRSIAPALGMGVAVGASAAATEADLDLLSADLNEVLSDVQGWDLVDNPAHAIF